MSGNRPSSSRTALALGAILLLLLAFFVAACGDSDSSSSTSTSSSDGTDTSSGGSGSSWDAKLEEELAPWKEIPTSIAQTEPLKKAPPSDATIAFLECAEPPCVEIGEGLEAASAEMGVNYKPLSAGSSPETFQAAAAQAVREKPDVLVMASLDGNLIAKQIAELKAEGVKIVNWSTSSRDTAVSEYDVFYIPPEYHESLGAASAQWVMLKSGEEANVVYVNQSLYGSIVSYGRGIEQALEAECPKCTFTEIDTLPEEVGTKIPSKVVSFLQQNPSEEYQIIVAYGAISLGLPQALKAAGLESTIAAGQAGSSNTWEDLKNGIQEMSMEIDLRLLGFYAMDASARLINGEEPLASEEVPWYQLVTGEEITFDPSKEKWTPLPNYEKEFAELWAGQ